MFKKIITFFLIFSILFTDLAHCGNTWGQGTADPEDDVNETRSLITQPSLHLNRQNTDQTYIPEISDFEEFAKDERHESVSSEAGIEDYDTQSSSPSFSPYQEQKTAYHHQSHKVFTPTDLQALAKGELKSLFPQSNTPRGIRKQTILSKPKDDASQGNLIPLILQGNDLNLTSEMQEFLKYVKYRVIDDKLNAIQKGGIVLGGVLTGLGVAWPSMLIFFNSIFEPFASDLLWFDDSLDPHLISPIFNTCSTYLNFYTLIPLAGIPLSLAAASRTALVSKELTKENIDFFSLKKTIRHKISLVCAKGMSYLSASFLALLPVYYLYNYLIFCNPHYHGGDDYTNTTHPFSFTYNVTTDIFAQTSFEFWINGTYYDCDSSQVDLQNIILFCIGGSFLFFEKLLYFGHKLSTKMTKSVNAYYFEEMRKSSPLLIAESKRENYITQFKDLKRIIHTLDEDSLDKLYTTVVGEEDTQISQATLPIFRVFKTLYDQNKNILEDGEENSELWKKNWASRIGWSATFLSTLGRIIIIQYIGNLLFNALGWDGTGASIFSYILASTVVNAIQGYLEKESMEQGMFDLLRGTKFSQSHSHQSLRQSIKTWDYMYGILNTLPYVMTCHKALQKAFGSFSQGWQYLLIIIIGFTETFKVVAELHEGNLNLVDTFDREMSSCHASQEYKKDKLIHICRDLSNLLKEVNNDVIEELDARINQANF